MSLFNVLSDDALNDYGLFTGDDTEAALTTAGIALRADVAQSAPRSAVPNTLLDAVEGSALECLSLPELEIAAAVLWDCMARGCDGDMAAVQFRSLEAAHGRVIGQGAVHLAERSAVEWAH
ncbi:MAG: hypothetical protein HY749_24010 [Gammaproteobacteria bacterium]|nr:hypothetical protein [Gammaproteobacteria bacterium]